MKWDSCRHATLSQTWDGEPQTCLLWALLSLQCCTWWVEPQVKLKLILEPSRAVNDIQGRIQELLYWKGAIIEASSREGKSRGTHLLTIFSELRMKSWPYNLQEMYEWHQNNIPVLHLITRTCGLCFFYSVAEREGCELPLDLYSWHCR